MKTKNGVKVRGSVRRSIFFDTDRDLQSRLRKVSEKTGISQRTILVSGLRKQLSELETRIQQETWPVETMK